MEVIDSPPSNGILSIEHNSLSLLSVLVEKLGNDIEMIDDLPIDLGLKVIPPQ